MKCINTAPDNMSLLMRRRNILVRHATVAERHVRKLLAVLDEPHIFQKGFCSQKRFFIVDFYFPKPLKVAVELDGSSHDHTQHYDNWRDRFLTEVRRIRIIRISDDRALKLTANCLFNLIRD